MARSLVDRVRRFDRNAARLLVHELAVRELFPNDIDLLDVLEPCRPGAGAQAPDAANDLGYSLEHYQGPGYRNYRFELVDWRPLGGHGRVLPDAPGFDGVVVPCVDEREDARDEKEEVERQVERRLGSRGEAPVHKVGAHVPTLGQRVGAAHHEERAIKHVVEVENPGRRRVQDVTLEDLHGNHQGSPRRSATRRSCPTSS